MKGTERTQVMWFGTKPSGRIVSEFERRDLTVCAVANKREIVDDSPSSRALIFDAGRADEVGLLLKIGEAALDHGLLVVPTAANIALQKHLHLDCSNTFSNVVKRNREPYRGIELGYVSLVSITNAPWKVAQRCVKWDPGPSANPELIILSATPIGEELLVRRAFSDFEKIEVHKLSTGMSGADVYKVFATPRPPITRPLPMYAKVDLLPRLESELTKYRNFVEPAVPFNLRPDLTSDHFAWGAKKGVLAGNFVEGSEPLWKAVRRGQGHEPIYSLFDHAFKAWRLCSLKERSISVIASLEGAGELPADEPDAQVVTELTRLGAEDPSKLLSRLRDLKASPHRIGIVHGDLHADNVCARGHDAILIDFYSVRPTAPLAFDAATLEISLAFRSYDQDDDDATWAKTVDTLYAPRYFSKPPGPAQEQHAREWLWNTVRQMRMIALANEASLREYQTVIAFSLIRICKHSPNEGFTAFRRAYGCLLAQRLIHDLESRRHESPANI